MEEDTEKMVTSIGPVHPETREAEFKHIKKGSYNIYLEVHVSTILQALHIMPILISGYLCGCPVDLSFVLLAMQEPDMSCKRLNKWNLLLSVVLFAMQQMSKLVV